MEDLALLEGPGLREGAEKPAVPECPVPVPESLRVDDPVRMVLRDPESRRRALGPIPIRVAGNEGRVGPGRALQPVREGTRTPCDLPARTTITNSGPAVGAPVPRFGPSPLPS